jgi:hypothetical protein
MNRQPPEIDAHGNAISNKRRKHSVEPTKRHYETKQSMLLQAAIPPAQSFSTSPEQAGVETTTSAQLFSPATSRNCPREPQSYGANSSALHLALNVFGEHERDLEGGLSTIPGHEGVSSEHGSRWSLHGMRMPPKSVMLALVDAYFERMHWFIFILHQPSFYEKVDKVLSRSTWTRFDLCDVVVILMVSAVGLQCVLQDSQWLGHELLRACSLDPATLKDDLLAEVQHCLVSLLDDCRIETVQVCILLGTHHIYHGSPTIAWSVLGLSVRVAYALSLHSQTTSNETCIDEEVRRRCWNHVTVADTFATMIYGRPSSLDPAFSQLHELCELDDTNIREETWELPILSQSYGSITGLTFHVLKYKLYEIIKHTLSSFRLLRLNNPISITALRSLVQAIRRAEASLRNWRLELPPFFDSKNWPGDDPWNLFEIGKITIDTKKQAARTTLLLQAATLQLTYESAVIFVHRPLLEHRVDLEAHENALGAELDSVPRSVDISVDAALRISRIPVTRFEQHLSIGFVLMHFFTAGIILCIPPTSHPFSHKAQEAKAGVARIIRASRALRVRSQVARHTEQLLTDLLKVTHERELDSALHTESREEIRTATTNAIAKIAPGNTMSGVWLNHTQIPPMTEDRHERMVPVPPEPFFAPTEDVLQSTSALHSHIDGSGDDLFSSESIESYLLSNSYIHNEGYGPAINDQLDGALGTFGQSESAPTLFYSQILLHVETESSFD